MLWCVQVRWREPEETGGRDIEEYQVQMSPGQNAEGHSEVTAPDFVASCISPGICACFTWCHGKGARGIQDCLLALTELGNLCLQAFVDVYRGKEIKQRVSQLQPATLYTFRVKV